VVQEGGLGEMFICACQLRRGEIYVCWTLRTVVIRDEAVVFCITLQITIVGMRRGCYVLDRYQGPLLFRMRPRCCMLDVKDHCCFMWWISMIIAIV